MLVTLSIAVLILVGWGWRMNYEDRQRKRKEWSGPATNPYWRARTQDHSPEAQAALEAALTRAYKDCR